jgi:CBS domain-containing protein
MDQTVGDIMTRNPRFLEASQPVVNAATLMRDEGIGAVVVNDSDQLYGILTDRDIVVRVLAEGRDPAGTRVGEICSKELTTVRPTDPLRHALELMRERTVRRLPVLDESGEVVGILSLGDIALEKDPASVLGEISAAPPNE